MSFYEHTFVGKQDISEKDVNNLIDICTNIIKKSGKLLKTENWGLLNLSYIIKKNKKGNYIHFKIDANSKVITELEKNEKIDKNLLRFLTVKVKKLDLKTNYFEKKSEESKEKSN